MQDNSLVEDHGFYGDIAPIENNMVQSIYPNMTEDTSEIHSKLESINILKEEAREEYHQYEQEYDKLLECVFSYLTH